MRRIKEEARGWIESDDPEYEWDASWRKAGLGDLHLHSLRHTTGALLAMGGYGAKTIADLLGHAQTHTADIYTHVTKEHVATALHAVNLGPIDLGKPSGIRPVGPKTKG